MGYSNKIELGCGSTKAAGFIGVDRFDLPGVDIVADMNQRLPFDDNSVDAVWCCHSLEHLSNIEFTMNEIYRIMRHGGILMVLAPYYWQTLGVVNSYHLVPFTEETFRFYSNSGSMEWCNYPNYDNCPHAAAFGLASSDNSQNVVNFEPLYQEFFYYESYRALPEAEKDRARRALLNVCDQFYTAVAVNKSDVAFTSTHVKQLCADAQMLEPKVVSEIRARDRQVGNAKGSVLTDIDKHIQNVQAQICARVEVVESSQEAEKTLHDRLQKRLILAEQRQEAVDVFAAQMATQLESFNERATALENSHNTFTQVAEEWANTMAEKLDASVAAADKRAATLEKNHNSLAQVAEERANTMMAELNQIGLQEQALQQRVEELTVRVERGEVESYEFARYRDLHCGILGKKLFHKSDNLADALSSLCRNFIDGLVFACPAYSRKRIIARSVVIPYNAPLVYQVRGCGNRIYMFLSGGGGANVGVTILQGKRVIHQSAIPSTVEGPVVVPCPGAEKSVTVHLILLGNRGIARVMEIQRRHLGIFSKAVLAAFIA